MENADAHAEVRSAIAKAEGSSAFARTFVSAFFGYLSVFVLVHFPGYLRETGASEAMIGAALGVGALAGIFARPFVGRLMDRRGRQPSLALGGVLLTLAAGMHLLIPGPGVMLFVVRALHGVAGGLLFSAVFSIAADLTSEEDRTKKLAIFGISGILPMSVGALVGDAVLARAGHEANFVLAAVFAFIALAIGLTVGETRMPSETKASAGLLEPLRDKALTGLWISGILFATSVASYFVYVRNFLDVEKLAPVSYFFTPYAAMAIVVRLGFSSLPRRLGEPATVASALFVLVVGLSSLAFARGPLGVVASGLLCGLGHAFVYPSLLTLFISRSEDSVRGAVVSMFTALMDVGMLISGYCFGWLADLEGHRTVFTLSSGIAGLALASFLIGAYRPRASTMDAAAQAPNLP